MNQGEMTGLSQRGRRVRGWFGMPGNVGTLRSARYNFGVRVDPTKYPTAPSASSGALRGVPPRPVNRLTRRWRNRICISIIAVGALNFMAYTVAYAVLGGDAHNGNIGLAETDDGGTRTAYYVRGHFIHSLAGKEAEVSRMVWIYSYLHSISVFVTSAAMIISMLVLARPHILATMRGAWISGRAFVICFGALVILVTSAAVLVFTLNFAAELRGA